MADVPVSIFTSKTVRAGQSPANPGFDQSGGTPVPVSPASPLSFLGLTDTPTSYVGQGGKTVAVKSDASGLEFVTGGGGGAGAGAGLSIDGDGNVQLGRGSKILEEDQYIPLNDFSQGSLYFFNNSIDRLPIGFISSNTDLGSLIEFNGFDVTGSLATTYFQMNSNNASRGIFTLGVRNELDERFDIILDSQEGAKISDSIFSKGLEEAGDYSANKTEFSYITPAWMKYQTGFNASVPQYFTHDGAGNFEWVDI